MSRRGSRLLAARRPAWWSPPPDRSAQAHDGRSPAPGTGRPHAWAMACLDDGSSPPSPHPHAGKDGRPNPRTNAACEPQPREGNDGPFTSILRIAVTPSYYDSEKGTYGDRKTEFITVFARNQLARNVLASVTKGQPLVVTGRLNSSEWTGVDGTVRHSLTVNADAIGHDLTFGRAVFTRPLKASDIPDHDPVTGEVVDRRGDDAAQTLTSDGADDEGLVAAG